MAGVVLLSEAEQFGHIFAERLDSFALGKLTTVCRAFKDWARSNGRSLRLVLQHPAVTMHQVPLKSVWRPLPDEGASSTPVPWVLNSYDLRIAPAFTSSYTPVWDKPPVNEVLFLPRETSAVDRVFCSMDLDLVHATTRAVEEKLIVNQGLTEDQDHPGQIKFRLKRLSSHFTPRAMLQLRLTIHVNLKAQTVFKTKAYVAYSDPMHVVSKIPTPRSVERSKARSRR